MKRGKVNFLGFYTLYLQYAQLLGVEMAFKSKVKKSIVHGKKTEDYLPCVMCGKTYPLPDAVHIIDEKEWKKYK